MSNYHYKLSWVKVIYFILLWILLYIEPLSIGPLKISQIWKGLLVTIMLFSVFRNNVPRFIIVGIIFAFKYLVYTEMFYGYLSAVQEMLESLIFPTFMGYLYVKYKNKVLDKESLIHMSISFSLFLIYSAVPILLGVQTFNPVSELNKYGIEANAMKGLFYHVATSSKLFTISTIVLVNTYNRFNYNIKGKLIWLIAVGLGTYFVYTSWTRTGWFIFFIALIISLFYGANFKRKLSAIIVSVMLVTGIYILYESNQAFRWRLTGGATYRQDTELTVDQLASARTPFIYVALDNMHEQGTMGQLLGYGYQKGVDLFQQKVGLSISSHNKTFEILESSGIIGLVLYFSFISNLVYRTLKNLKYADFELKKLGIITIFLFFGFYFTSHGTPLWGELIYSCILSSIIFRFNNKMINLQPKSLEIKNT